MQRRLKTSEDVRGYLAYLIRSVEAGSMDPAKGWRLAYIANILLRAIESGEIEGGLEAIEEQLSRKGK
jgi:hypothetical protein